MLGALITQPPASMPVRCCSGGGPSFGNEQNITVDPATLTTLKTKWVTEVKMDMNELSKQQESFFRLAAALIGAGMGFQALSRGDLRYLVAPVSARGPVRYGGRN